MTRDKFGFGHSARLMIPAAALASATLIGFAAPAWSAGNMVACSASAHIKDKWGETTNIRAQPSSKSAVAARIAFAKKGSVEVPRTLRLSGQSGNWFRVSQVHSGGKVKFRGRGWIHGSLVAVSIRSRA